MIDHATRVAALYDIHGNLPALEAVLQAIGEAGVETGSVPDYPQAGEFAADNVLCPPGEAGMLHAFERAAMR